MFELFIILQIGHEGWKVNSESGPLGAPLPHHSSSTRLHHGVMVQITTAWPGFPTLERTEEIKPTCMFWQQIAPRIVSHARFLRYSLPLDQWSATRALPYEHETYPTQITCYQIYFFYAVCARQTRLRFEAD